MKTSTRLGPFVLLAILTICVACAAHALPLDSTAPLAVDPPSIVQPIAIGEAPDQGAAPAADNPDPPSAPVKLIFVHHSTGGNWLADPDTNSGSDNPGGGLGRALMNNNYYVSATNYGWEVGGDAIGDRTDIPNWPEWFTGTHRDDIMAALYAETGQYFQDYGTWPRMGTDPGAQNEIVMFKSCFPNSDLYGNPTDPPLSTPNDQYTVANAKAVYNDILTYFEARQDRLFVVITAPPLAAGETNSDRAANARAFNNWLMNDWLDGYAYNNVAVFDYYNVLTSNGGDADTNDVGQATGNHHRWWSGAVQHVQTVNSNYAAYPSGDSHPTTAGHQKATAEFVPLLNVFYHRWQSGGTSAPALALTSPQGGELWPVGSARQIQWTTTGTVAQVNLSYSTDGFGASQPIASAIANAGSYAWTTPLTPSTSAQVRVESVVSPTTVYDVSGAFTLYDPATLQESTYLPLALRDHTSTPTPLPPAGDLIDPADLAYQGAFRLPDTADELGWTWSGHALAYYPDGDGSGSADGYPGSLFGTGNDQKQWVSEVDIPVPVISAAKDVEDLNTAGTIQDFHNVRGTLYDDIEGFDEFVDAIAKAGLAYLPAQGAQSSGKLYFCWGYHLQFVPRDSEESLHGEPDVSHGWCELDLSDPQPVGAWTVGDYVNWVTNDYLFPVDPAWAAANTPGKLLVTGRFRDGGQGGRGPSLLAIGPWGEGNPPPAGTELSTVPLLLYTSILAGDSHTLSGYSHADEWMGGAWLTTGDRSAVIVVGTKGLGDTWYGYVDGTVWPEEPPYPPEGPGERGWWADRFAGRFLFYDPADLAAVARGEMEPYEPQPYATLDVDQHLYNVTSTRQWHHLGAAAFDRTRGLLYVLEPLADEDKSLVHVWRVE
jgi:hypothetical protein